MPRLGSWRRASTPLMAVLASSCGTAPTEGMLEVDLAAGFDPVPVGTLQEVWSISGRDLLVEVWYPAAQTSSRTAYMDSPTASIWGGRVGLPPGFEDRVRIDRTFDAAWANSPASWPVVLFAPGLSWPVATYQSLRWSLVSRGFVVVALHPPGGSDPIVYPDGRVTRFDFWPEGLDPDDQEGTARALEENLEVWIEDLRGLLGEIKRRQELTEDRGWVARLDLSRVGLVGHSYGGSAGARLINSDDRVQAVVAIEGGVYPKGSGPIRVERPFLHLFSADDEEAYAGRFDGSRDIVWEAALRGASHGTCSDHVFLQAAFAAEDSPDVDAIDPRRGLEVTNRLLAAFLVHFVGGDREAWSDFATERSSMPELALVTGLG